MRKALAIGTVQTLPGEVQIDGPGFDPHRQTLSLRLLGDPQRSLRRQVHDVDRCAGGLDHGYGPLGGDDLSERRSAVRIVPERSPTRGGQLLDGAFYDGPILAVKHRQNAGLPCRVQYRQVAADVVIEIGTGHEDLDGGLAGVGAQGSQLVLLVVRVVDNRMEHEVRDRVPANRRDLAFDGSGKGSSAPGGTLR